MDSTGSDRAGTVGWWAPAASAAAVAVVVLAGVGLSQLDLDANGSRGREAPDGMGPDGSIQRVTQATNGRVADVFTCPSTIPYDFGGGDSALESAALDGPRAFADAMGAARFELVGGPDATVLRLGNDDGSLASLNTMHRTEGGWVLDDMTACDGRDNMLVAAPNHAELGLHGPEPWPAENVLGSDLDSVLVDDRAYYNAAGVVQHRSIHAFPCGEEVCFAASEGGGDVTAEFVAGDAVPKDLTSFFLPEHALQDRPPLYSFLAVYDPGDQVARVAWEPSRGGMVQWVEPVDTGPWPGRLFLVLATHDPDGTVLVYPRDGGVRAYDARGYALP